MILVALYVLAVSRVSAKFVLVCRCRCLFQCVILFVGLWETGREGGERRDERGEKRESEREQREREKRDG